MHQQYGFNISGIQQVGVGTENFRKSWNWFIRMFGTDVKILEDDTVAERMLPYTGNQPQKRHACIAVNLQGGGGFEIWQYSERKPQPVGFDIAVGDLGVFAAKLNCRDIPACHQALKAKWDAVSDVGALPDGTPCFYVKDLYGNCFQLVQTDYIYIDEGKLTGGMAGTVVGVTDMDKSIAFYREILGYDTVKYDETGVFADWSPSGRRRKVPPRPDGPFEAPPGGLLRPDGPGLHRTGAGAGPHPAKDLRGPLLGRPGLHPDLLRRHRDAGTGEILRGEGPSLHRGQLPRRHHLRHGRRLRPLHLHRGPGRHPYIDMKKRDPRKPLPKFLFRAMGLVSREKEK